jgi:hypothetical protein
MNRKDKPPQTVAEALQHGWTYLPLRCALCRHTGRIELSERPPGELIASTIQRAHCPRRCSGGLVDAKIGMVLVHKHEMPITFEGTTTLRLGMN